MEKTEPTDAERGAKLRAEGEKWMERIHAAEKREDDWRKDAEAAEAAYACDGKGSKGKLYDFNILHSNVETIVPAIYNSTPVPDVRSRNIIAKPELPEMPQMQPGQQPDPRMMQMMQIAKQRAQAVEAQIKAAKDFGTMIERAITVQIDDNKLDTEIESCAQDAFLSGRGIVRIRFEADEAGEGVANERLVYEAVSWRDYRYGPCKRWGDRPWEAFRHSMVREEAERLSDKEMLESQNLPTDRADSDDEDDIAVWEVWCKSPKRYVKFVRESDGKIMNEIEDPLGLTDFFSTPPAIQPISLTGKTKPVCPFTVYKKLADELDTITKRINAIMKGLKVRGLVAGDASDVELLAQAGDNELVTAKNLEGLAQTGGIDKAIMWWPIETAIAVLQQLYLQREQVKAAIYELTGISDIVRGASDANETARAQEIKTQWGALRIQKMQRLIQRLVRNLFIMSAEIITTKFSAQTLQQMTGIEITPDIQQLMEKRVLAAYRVDVESDSTVKADTTRIRGEMGEFMQGTGQYFATMAPLIQESPEMAEPVAEIYSSFARNFNLGKQAEDALDSLTEKAKQAAKKPRPNPEAEKMKGEMEMEKARLQMDMQRVQAEIRGKQQELAMKAQSEQAKTQTDAQRAQIDLQKAAIELKIKVLEFELKQKEAALNLQTKQAETGMKLSAQQQTNDLKADAARQSMALKEQQAKQKKPAKAN